MRAYAPLAAFAHGAESGVTRLVSGLHLSRATVMSWDDGEHTIYNHAAERNE